MYDIIVVGGGPAGFTAAIYAGRAKLKTLLIEKAFFGGQITKTNGMENYPGFEVISGIELAEKLTGQAKKFGAEIVQEEVLEVSLNQTIKTVKTNKNMYKAKVVIICTGASPRELGLHKEKELTGSGISYCATCDGAFFKGQNVAVIGGGDTAAEDILYLSRFCKQIYLVHRKNHMRAAKVLQDMALGNSRVIPKWDSVAEEILGDLKVAGLRIRNTKSGKTSELAVGGIFIAIGNIPNSELVKGKVELNENGYIKTDESMGTQIAGVYAAGDVREKTLMQVVTAASDGAVAAYSAQKYISENNL